MVKPRPQIITHDQGVRERLLKAGIELFARNGYAATSVREIVARSGVTKPVLYYYFGSKEGLYKAIIEEALITQQAVLDEILSKSGSALDRLFFLFERILRAVRENRDLVKMTHSLRFGPPQGAPQVDITQFGDRMIEAIKTIYLDGLAQGSVVEFDPDTVVSTILAMLDHAVCLDFAPPELADLKRPMKMLGFLSRALQRKDN